MTKHVYDIIRLLQTLCKYKAQKTHLNDLVIVGLGGAGGGGEGVNMLLQINYKR